MTTGYLDGLKFHKQMNTCLALPERLREGEEFALKFFTHHKANRE